MACQPKLAMFKELKVGGGRGIRTPGTLPGTVVFKTTAIDHSAIPPRRLPQHSAPISNALATRSTAWGRLICASGADDDRVQV